MKDDPRVKRILGGVSVHDDLVSEAYAKSTWWWVILADENVVSDAG
jgi:hypothetical protein